MEVVVAGWVGSTNLGDELVHAGVRRLLDAAGASRVVVISTDPAATAHLHGPETVSHRDLPGIWRAVGRADLLVYGGGGITQDLTSRFNLPYHLSRPWLARRRGTPWVGLALGIGPIVTGTGRRLAGYLNTAEAVSVRDAASAEALAECGVRGVSVTADAAFALPTIDAPPDDVVTVSLRAWTGGGVLPVGSRAGETPPWFVPRVAAALDAVAERTGLPIELVALQTDRDHRVHLEVEAAMRAPATCVQPPLGSLVETVGRGRLVIAMRYHAGVAAVLAGRPVVTIGYTPKVEGLAGDLGAGGALLDFSPEGVDELPDAVDAVAGREAEALAAREALTERAWRNLETIRAGLAAGR